MFIEVWITSGHEQSKWARRASCTVCLQHMLFIFQWTLNKLLLLLIFKLFSIPYLTQKSGLAAKIETRKQLHAVFFFLLIVEQRRWRRNVAIV